jgi:CubicO group peptidase (beta-lactamase class C family)
MKSDIKKKMKRLLFFFLLSPFVLCAQNIPVNADKLLTAYTDQHKFSGNVLIAEKGKIMFEKSYGYADINTKSRNNPTTEFRAGSLTKMFTSTIILQLADQKLLSLTDPVSKYVPSLKCGIGVQITHLLSHSSGISGTTIGEAKNLLESVSLFRCDSLKFQPGSQFDYNNFNYILLSYIAEKATGKPLNSLFKSLLSQAGMLSSGLDSKDRPSNNKAKGYITNPATAEWEHVQDPKVSVASGAGALYTTSHDLLKWSEFITTNKILPKPLVELAWAPVQNNYGLGWMTMEQFGTKQKGHTGSIPGFIASFMIFPKEEVTIILLSNYQDTDGRRLNQDLAAVAMGKDFQIPVQKKEITLSSDVLNRYTGTYKLQNGFTITVTSEGSQLFAQAQGDPMKVELSAEGENKFYLKGPETAIEFLSENGQVKYMFVDMQGGQKLTKVL